MLSDEYPPVLWQRFVTILEDFDAVFVPPVVQHLLYSTSAVFMDQKFWTSISVMFSQEAKAEDRASKLSKGLKL